MREQQGKLAHAVHDVPREIDAQVARLKLAALDIEIDELSAEQRDYLSAWQEGT